MVFLTLCPLIISSCHQNSVCKEFQISEIFKESMDMTEYCKLMSKSIAGDSIAFNELINLECESGLCIDHAYNITQLVAQIGEERVCNWIRSSTISLDDIGKIYALSQNKKLVYFADSLAPDSCSIIRFR